MRTNSDLVETKSQSMRSAAADVPEFRRLLISILCYITMGDDGGGQWLVRMEWRPAGWSVCLPLLISTCTIKSRSSLLALAHPGGPRNKGRKMVVCVCVCVCYITMDVE